MLSVLAVHILTWAHSTHLLCSCQLLGQMSEGMEASHMHGSASSSQISKDIQGAPKITSWNEKFKGFLGSCNLLYHLQLQRPFMRAATRLWHSSKTAWTSLSELEAATLAFK